MKKFFSILVVVAAIACVAVSCKSKEEKAMDALQDALENLDF